MILRDFSIRTLTPLVLSSVIANFTTQAIFRHFLHENYDAIFSTLRQEGFDSRVCPRGDLALAEFRDYKPDVLLLDLMLPGKDGIDVCKEIRAESGVPIVMLTAKGDTVDVVVGLESGADDYVVKPFKPKELVARMRARLRRNDPGTVEVLHIGDLTIDVAGHVVSRDGAPISLTPNS